MHCPPHTLAAIAAHGRSFLLSLSPAAPSPCGGGLRGTATQTSSPQSPPWQLRLENEHNLADRISWEDNYVLQDCWEKLTGCQQISKNPNGSHESRAITRWSGASSHTCRFVHLDPHRRPGALLSASTNLAVTRPRRPLKSCLPPSNLCSPALCSSRYSVHVACSPFQPL